MGSALVRVERRIGKGRESERICIMAIFVTQLHETFESRESGLER